VAIGESVLFESYFVCITISGQNTLIEYGKNIGTKDGGNVYLNMIDNKRNFDIRFYAFGNKDDPVNIMDAHIVSHNQTKVQCKGNTVKDAIENMCANNCHRDCDPVAGLYFTRRKWCAWLVRFKRFFKRVWPSPELCPVVLNKV